VSSATLAVIVLCVAALLVAVAVAWPLILRDEPSAALAAEEQAREADRARDVEEALERSLAAIREIDTDHRAGNLSDEDFAALDRAERARAAELLRQRDADTAP
jgi:biopolymer transport protein ExbB/TolQ